MAACIEIFPLQSSNSTALNSLLDQWGNLPWPGVRQVTETLRRNFLRRRVRGFLESGGSNTHAFGALGSEGASGSVVAVSRRKGKGQRSKSLDAFVLLNLLDWDTDLLGVRCARIEHLCARGSYQEQQAALTRLLPEAIGWLEAQGVRMVHARLPVLATAVIHALEEVGFRFLTNVSCFYRAPGNLAAAFMRSLGQRFQVRQSRKDDLSHLQTMAEGAFHQNRFSLDPHLDADNINRLYSTWITNALQRKGSRLLICEQQRRPIAFLLYEIQKYTAGKERFRLGRLVLAASADAERSRGAALACLLHCMRELQGQADVLEAVVGTTNEAACRALRRFGFHSLNTLIDLHAWL